MANGRILSDGVCSAYLVDIWTASSHHRQGIGCQVATRLLATVPGQHLAPFASQQPDFHTALGFQPEHVGMSQAIGTWLNRN